MNIRTINEMEKINGLYLPDDILAKITLIPVKQMENVILSLRTTNII